MKLFSKTGKRALTATEAKTRTPFRTDELKSEISTAINRETAALDSQSIGRQGAASAAEHVEPVAPQGGRQVAAPTEMSVEPDAPQSGRLSATPTEMPQQEPIDLSVIHDTTVIPYVPETGAHIAPAKTVGKATQYEINYPEPLWSDEQKKALKLAREQKKAKTKPIPEDVGKRGYKHLEPPKRSPIKIILTVLVSLILAGGVGYAAWYYWWTQFATFDYTLQPIVILDGQSVTPDEFLPESEKAKGITASFQDPLFTPVPGWLTVGLTLELGLRSLETNATLYVLTPVKGLLHEYRDSSITLLPENLLSNTEITRGTLYDVHFTQEPLPLSDYKVGDHTLHLSLNDAPFSVTLTVYDSTPPNATPVSTEVLIGEEVTPEDFVEDVFDHSGVALIEFVEPPNTFSHQEQIVEIMLADIYGNIKTVAGSLNIITNTEFPVIIGVPELIESTRGDAIIYRTGVQAFDDFGRELEFVVDSSNVDQDKVGDYIATFIAEDLTGLITQLEVPVRIIGADIEFVDNWIDTKLAEIIKDDMTQEQQLRAIRGAIKGILSYAGNDARGPGDANPDSIYDLAYRGMVDRRGNCYHYYALGELMLTRAGIPNIRIERRAERSDGYKYPTKHFWSLVNPDEKGWYHFDSMPSGEGWVDNARNMFTQSRAEEMDNYMAQPGRYGAKGYYDYDPELYPEVVP